MRTTDLTFVSSAVINGFAYTDLTIINGHGTFTFDDSAELKKFESDFLIGNVRIEPNTFNKVFRNLHQQVKDERNFA